jgi:phage baseplate assembly protein gpV
MGQMKRGIVVAGRGSQVKVRFEDEDGLISPWLDMAQASTIGKQFYRRFKVGELVRCYLDEKGESGEAFYAIYNDAAPAPADSDDVLHFVMPDGAVVVWEPGKFTATDVGGNSLTLSGGAFVIDGNVTINGNVTIVGGSVTHNGNNIGDSHTHSHGDPAGRTSGPS